MADLDNFEAQKQAELFLEGKAPTRENLKEFTADMKEADVREFYKALASNPRIDKYLPKLSLEAVTVSPNGVTDPGITPKFRPQQYEFTKKELLDAAANPRLNALDKKSLKFAIQRFDDFTDFDQRDTKYYGLADNSNHITLNDLRRGYQSLWDRDRQKRFVTAGRQMLNHFETIDQDHSGKITDGEVKQWLNVNNKWDADALSGCYYGAGPRPTAYQKSEELSKDELKQRIEAARKERDKLDFIWGKS